MPLRRIVGLLIAFAMQGAAMAENWTQFRGGTLQAVSGHDAPVRFEVPPSWKITIPAGNSSPIIWEDQLFITGMVSNDLITLCYDTKTGEMKWSQKVTATALEKTHRLGNPATPTPATDGAMVYSYFGSFGVVAYDMEGKAKWEHRLPTPMVEFGTGTSPLLWNDTLFLIVDQDQDSYLLALDKKTGNQKWRVNRPEFRRGFASPIIWAQSNRTDLVVPGSIWLTGYDPETGKERWRVAGTSRVATSTPSCTSNLLVYCSWNVGGDSDSRVSMPEFGEFLKTNDKNGDGKLQFDELPSGVIKDRFTQMDFNKDGSVTGEEWTKMAEMFQKAENSIFSIRAGGTGDITATHMIWKQTKHLSYVSSPLLYQGRIWSVKNGGMLSCYDLLTGKALVEAERLGAPGDYYASPVAAGDNLYFLSQQGKMTIVRNTPELSILGSHDFHEQTMATPAIAGRSIYLRGEKTLYCFKNEVISK
ncbi:MAG: Pyrrolo-quinoline quinone [Verrucomicrobiales bacterium]|nr:Pyrrolo-quinoline quinone [Verrucomicrobiales bacterium]